MYRAANYNVLMLAAGSSARGNTGEVTVTAVEVHGSEHMHTAQQLQPSLCIMWDADSVPYTEAVFSAMLQEIGEAQVQIQTPMQPRHGPYSLPRAVLLQSCPVLVKPGKSGRSLPHALTCTHMYTAYAASAHHAARSRLPAICQLHQRCPSFHARFHTKHGLRPSSAPDFPQLPSTPGQAFAKPGSHHAGSKPGRIRHRRHSCVTV